jgi:sulfate adenylyltransferase subunit 2
MRRPRNAGKQAAECRREHDAEHRHAALDQGDVDREFTIAVDELFSAIERIDQPEALTHLQRLEAESIHIMREVVAEAENPVMLYSVGKDSAVMLHLAMKAFYPRRRRFRCCTSTPRGNSRRCTNSAMRWHASWAWICWCISIPMPSRATSTRSTHGSAIHTDMWKTEGLKQALDKYGFDAAFGGARRDEEKSRAKERIFLLPHAQHRWDPKSQRPELWSLYNARKHKGESIRVFPISNWTELDIWQYIHLENIPIVPLYFAAPSARWWSATAR